MNGLLRPTFLNLSKDIQDTFILNDELLEIFDKDAIHSVFISKHSKAPTESTISLL